MLSNTPLVSRAFDAMFGLIVIMSDVAHRNVVETRWRDVSGMMPFWSLVKCRAPLQGECRRWRR